MGPHWRRPFFFPLRCKLLYWKNRDTNSLTLTDYPTMRWVKMKIRVSAVFCFVFSGILKIAFSARLTTMGENWKALRTVFFLSKTSDLLGGTVKNTGRLPRMLPVIFRELSWTIFRFSRVLVWFRRSQSVFCGGSKIRLSELGPEIRDLWSFLVRNHNVLITGNMDEQPNYDPGETENCSRKLSKNQGEHPEESTGVFDRPAE